MDAIERALKTLGLSADATPQDVKQAYRDLAKVWHPDRFPNDPRLQRKAEEKLKEINAAYKLIENYDAFLRLSPRHTDEKSQGSASPPFQSRGKEKTGSIIQRFREPIQRLGFVIVTIIAIPVFVYLLENLKSESEKASNTDYFKKADGRHTPILDIGNLKQSSSVLQSRIENRKPIRPLTGFPPATKDIPPKQVNRFPAFTFSVGSTKEAVLELQGRPTDFDEQVWRYGSSKVFFKDDKVTGWEIGPDSPLNVKVDGSKNNYP